MNKHAMVAAASILIPLCACGGFRPRPLPEKETRLKVPYVSDRREQWGPAAVADVLGFWGAPVELKTLRRGVRFTRKPEEVALDLENAGRVHGFKSELTKADLPAIKRELDAGRPVIALVNVGFRLIPLRAYVVVTGYSDHRRCVYAHWGPNKDFYVSYRQFEADWRKSGNWLLRVSGTKMTARAEPLPDIKERPAAVRAPPPDAKTPTALEDPQMPELLWLTP